MNARSIKIATAWAMLRARLYEVELQRREEEANAQAEQKTEIGWGHQSVPGCNLIKW